MWCLIYLNDPPGSQERDIVIYLELDDPNAKEEAKRKARESWDNEFNRGYNKDPRFGWIEPLDN